MNILEAYEEMESGKSKPKPSITKHPMYDFYASFTDRDLIIEYKCLDLKLGKNPREKEYLNVMKLVVQNKGLLKSTFQKVPRKEGKGKRDFQREYKLLPNLN